jgi:hypothetical protein
MTAEYGQLNDKIEKATITTTKQPEEDRAVPEAKKFRVQESDPKKSTTNELGTPKTLAKIFDEQLESRVSRIRLLSHES